AFSVQQSEALLRQVLMGKNYRDGILIPSVQDVTGDSEFSLNQLKKPVITVRIQYGDIEDVHLVITSLRDGRLAPFTVLTSKSPDTAETVKREFELLEPYRGDRHATTVIALGSFPVNDRDVYGYSCRFLDRHSELVYASRSEYVVNEETPGNFTKNSDIGTAVGEIKGTGTAKIIAAFARLATYFYDPEAGTRVKDLTSTGGDVNFNDDQFVSETYGIYDVDPAVSKLDAKLIAYRDQVRGVDIPRFIQYLFSFDFLTALHKDIVDDPPYDGWLREGVLRGLFEGMAEKYGPDEGKRKAAEWLNRYLEEVSAERIPADPLFTPESIRDFIAARSETRTAPFWEDAQLMDVFLRFTGKEKRSKTDKEKLLREIERVEGVPVRMVDRTSVGPARQGMKLWRRRLHQFEVIRKDNERILYQIPKDPAFEGMKTVKRFNENGILDTFFEINPHAPNAREHPMSYHHFIQRGDVNAAYYDEGLRVFREDTPFIRVRQISEDDFVRHFVETAKRDDKVQQGLSPVEREELDRFNAALLDLNGKLRPALMQHGDFPHACGYSARLSGKILEAHGFKGWLFYQTNLPNEPTLQNYAGLTVAGVDLVLDLAADTSEWRQIDPGKNIWEMRDIGIVVLPRWKVKREPARYRIYSTMTVQETLRRVMHGNITMPDGSIIPANADKDGNWLPGYGPETWDGHRSEMRTRSREDARFISVGQKYIDRLSEADDFTNTIPDAFVVLGNPYVRPILEFAEKWKEIFETKGIAVPVVISGGRGKCTAPMIRRTIAHYRGSLTPDERRWLRKALDSEEIPEADVIRWILAKAGLPVGDSKVFAFEKQSRATAENFAYSRNVLRPFVQGKKNPLIAIVTVPPFLMRAKASADKLWEREIRDGWQVRRFRTSGVRLNEWSTNDLIEIIGSTAGYPRKYFLKYPGLNPYNEFRGSQAKYNPNVITIPVNQAEWGLLGQVRKQFEHFLYRHRSRLRFDSQARKLTLERSEMRGIPAKRQLTAAELDWLKPKFLGTVREFFDQLEEWERDHSDSKLIVLVRHGESMSNLFQYLQSFVDFTPLTLRGIRQAHALETFFSKRPRGAVRFGRILTSDLERAYRTVEGPATQGGKRPEIVTSLREALLTPIGGGIPLAFFEELGFDLWKPFMGDPLAYEIPGQYAVKEVQEDLQRLFNDDIAKGQDTRVMIGTHGVTLFLAMMEMLGIPYHKYETVWKKLGKSNNASITVMSYTPGKTQPWDLWVYADDSYLDGEIRGKTTGRTETALNYLMYYGLAVSRLAAAHFDTRYGVLPDFAPTWRTFFPPSKRQTEKLLEPYWDENRVSRSANRSEMREEPIWNAEFGIRNEADRLRPPQSVSSAQKALTFRFYHDLTPDERRNQKWLNFRHLFWRPLGWKQEFDALIAYQDGKHAAAWAFSEDPSDAHAIEDQGLFVHPNRRQQRIGYELRKQLLIYLKDRGYHVFHIGSPRFRIQADDPVAQVFHEGISGLPGVTVERDGEGKIVYQDVDLQHFDPKLLETRSEGRRVAQESIEVKIARDEKKHLYVFNIRDGRNRFSRFRFTTWDHELLRSLKVQRAEIQEHTAAGWREVASDRKALIADFLIYVLEMTNYGRHDLRMDVDYRQDGLSLGREVADSRSITPTAHEISFQDDNRKNWGMLSLVLAMLALESESNAAAASGFFNKSDFAGALAWVAQVSLEKIARSEVRTGLAAARLELLKQHLSVWNPKNEFVRTALETWRPRFLEEVDRALALLDAGEYFEAVQLMDELLNRFRDNQFRHQTLELEMLTCISAIVQESLDAEAFLWIGSLRQYRKEGLEAFLKRKFGITFEQLLREVKQIDFESLDAVRDAFFTMALHSIFFTAIQQDMVEELLLDGLNENYTGFIDGLKRSSRNLRTSHLRDISAWCRALQYFVWRIRQRSKQVEKGELSVDQRDRGDGAVDLLRSETRPVKLPAAGQASQDIWGKTSRGEWVLLYQGRRNRWRPLVAQWLADYETIRIDSVPLDPKRGRVNLPGFGDIAYLRKFAGGTASVLLRRSKYAGRYFPVEVVAHKGRRKTTFKFKTVMGRRNPKASYELVYTYRDTAPEDHGRNWAAVFPELKISERLDTDGNLHVLGIPSAAQFGTSAARKMTQTYLVWAPATQQYVITQAKLASSKKPRVFKLIWGKHAGQQDYELLGSYDRGKRKDNLGFDPREYPRIKITNVRTDKNGHFSALGQNMIGNFSFGRGTATVYMNHSDGSYAYQTVYAEGRSADGEVAQTLWFTLIGSPEPTPSLDFNQVKVRTSSHRGQWRWGWLSYHAPVKTGDFVWVPWRKLAEGLYYSPADKSLYELKQEQTAIYGVYRWHSKSPELLGVWFDDHWIPRSDLAAHKASLTETQRRDYARYLYQREPRGTISSYEERVRSRMLAAVPNAFEPADTQPLREDILRLTQSSSIADRFLSLMPDEMLSPEATDYLLRLVRRADEALYRATGSNRAMHGTSKVYGKEHWQMVASLIQDRQNGDTPKFQWDPTLSAGQREYLRPVMMSGIAAQRILTEFNLAVPLKCLAHDSKLRTLRRFMRRDPDMFFLYHSIGTDGLLNGIWSFDSLRGASFNTHLWNKTVSAIRDGMRASMSERTMINRTQVGKIHRVDLSRDADAEDEPLTFFEPSQPGTAELTMMREDLWRKLTQGLSKRRAAILRYRFLEGLTQAEIAERLHLSPSAVSLILKGILLDLAASENKTALLTEFLDLQDDAVIEKRSEMRNNTAAEEKKYSTRGMMYDDRKWAGAGRFVISDSSWEGWKTGSAKNQMVLDGEKTVAVFAFEEEVWGVRLLALAVDSQSDSETQAAILTYILQTLIDERLTDERPMIYFEMRDLIVPLAQTVAGLGFKSKQVKKEGMSEDVIEFSYIKPFSDEAPDGQIEVSAEIIQGPIHVRYFARHNDLSQLVEIEDVTDQPAYLRWRSNRFVEHNNIGSGAQDTPVKGLIYVAADRNNRVGGSAAVLLKRWEGVEVSNFKINPVFGDRWVASSLMGHLIESCSW
ncbi:MAG: histidine phosphatase family protein, partial [Candidatus Omnitrophica bacterium]|nr:histidine phosphatase family protein [Candidatus Omnitrophota bacterium]